MREHHAPSGAAARLAAVAVTGLLLAGTAACDPTGGSDAAQPGASAVVAPTVASTAPSRTATSPATHPLPTRTATARPIATASASATAAGAPPVLGASWAPHQEGYGLVRPATVFNGGDPTGLVDHLTWSSWGGATATGSGTAEYVGPGQSVATGTPDHADVVAFDLGACNGKKAYRAIAWYFPDQGQHFDATRYLDACTGTDHGL